VWYYFFFYLRAVFPLSLMLATASAQVCVPLGHSSLYSTIVIFVVLTFNIALVFLNLYVKCVYCEI